MKVVLRSDVAGLGRRGDLVEVADGYARNYLVPRGDAQRATPGIAAQAAAMRRARDVKDVRDREAAEELGRRLGSTVVNASARAGTEGRLFGSVTAADVSAALLAQTGIDLDRRRLDLAEPIRSLGVHRLAVRVHPEVEIFLTVEVVAET